MLVADLTCGALISRRTTGLQPRPPRLYLGQVRPIKPASLQTHTLPRWHSAVASQQEGRGFKSRIVQHVGACSRAFLCGVCMFSPCSPHRTPTIKNMQKEQMLVGPDPDQVRTERLDLVPGCCIAGRPLLLDVPGGRMPGWDKSREQLPPSSHLHVCVCVSPLMCNVCVCRVAIKRACPPDFIFTFFLKYFS